MGFCISSRFASPASPAPPASLSETTHTETTHTETTHTEITHTKTTPTGINGNGSCSVRGSGAALVGCARLWPAAALFCCAATLSDCKLQDGLVVAWSAVVGCGRLRRCPVANCNRSRSVRGWLRGCVVGCARLRRCLIVNCIGCTFPELCLRG